ncbi:GABRR3 [Symbiodinium necroappetens]|uniref:GABRR3 protein n=1 Tax=Symbiodinium necroappetens TaxID=1628268 RepID=A0A813C5F5_9DINO|nr:GABRR3 [Symbiodinium necroappetens]
MGLGHYLHGLGAREAAILIINACLMGLAGEAGIDSAQFYHPGKDLKEGTTSLNKFPIPTPTAQCVEHVFQQHISPDSMNAWTSRCRARCSGPKTAADFQKQVLHGKEYEKAFPPSTHCDAPVDIQIQFFLQSFDAVDEQHESVTVTGYLRHWWVDDRLAFVHNDTCTESVYIPASLIWTPNLYIYNAIQQAHQENGIITAVHPNGTVFHSVAFHGSLKCSMQYHRMPYDSHGCYMKVGRYDATVDSIRVRPRNGAEKNMGKTGIGVVGDKMFSPSWFIENEQAIQNPGLRIQKYWPDLGGSTDIVFLPFTFSRRPGYLVRMVLVPSWLFLLVSYTGFFIDPSSAPARAAVALLPVLIMRTLQGFVFSKLPQVATCVWLTDYLLVSMILCCYAAIHLAIVQLLLISEHKAAENLKQLQKVEAKARELIQDSLKKKKFVVELLQDYQPVKQTRNYHDVHLSYLAKMREDLQKTRSYTEMTDSPKRAKHDGSEDVKIPLIAVEDSTPTSKPRTSSAAEDFESRCSFHIDFGSRSHLSPIEKEVTTEGDLLVIRRLLSLWEKEVTGDPPLADPEMLRRVMTRFNIFLTTADAEDIMCMFLRDKGFDTPVETGDVRIIFSLFMELLLDMEKYKFAVQPPPWYNLPLSPRVPWSRRLDVSLQILFPLFVALHALIFFSLIRAYPQNPDIGLVEDMDRIMEWQ